MTAIMGDPVMRFLSSSLCAAGVFINLSGNGRVCAAFICIQIYFIDRKLDCSL